MVVKFENAHSPSAPELAEVLKSHMIIFKPRRHTHIFQLHTCTVPELPPQAEHTSQSVTLSQPVHSSSIQGDVLLLLHSSLFFAKRVGTTIMAQTTMYPVCSDGAEKMCYRAWWVTTMP